MVTQFGMSKIGPIALEGNGSDEVFLGGNTGQTIEYSKDVANRIDTEVSEIINYCEKKALQIILDNRVIIDLIVEKLLEVETLDGEEFRELLRQKLVFLAQKLNLLYQIQRFLCFLINLDNRLILYVHGSTAC